MRLVRKAIKCHGCQKRLWAMIKVDPVTGSHLKYISIDGGVRRCNPLTSWNGTFCHACALKLDQKASECRDTAPETARRTKPAEPSKPPLDSLEHEARQALQGIGAHYGEDVLANVLWKLGANVRSYLKSLPQTAPDDSEVEQTKAADSGESGETGDKTADEKDLLQQGDDEARSEEDGDDEEDEEDAHDSRTNAIIAYQKGIDLFPTEGIKAVTKLVDRGWKPKDFERAKKVVEYVGGDTKLFEVVPVVEAVKNTEDAFTVADLRSEFSCFSAEAIYDLLQAIGGVPDASFNDFLRMLRDELNEYYDFDVERIFWKFPGTHQPLHVIEHELRRRKDEYSVILRAIAKKLAEDDVEFMFFFERLQEIGIVALDEYDVEY